MFSNIDLRSWIVEALYRIPGILIGLSFHEWAHAYAAYKRGDPTARNLGRMTVNPIAHLDPIGIVMLLIVGFGWARPVPVNPRNFKNPRKDDIIVSLAGVTTNIIIAFVFMGLLYALSLFTQNEVAYYLILYVVYINVGLFIFNLIPVPPLDGYHVFQALFVRYLGYRFFQFLERYGSYILIAIVLGASGVLGAAVEGIIGLFDSFYSWLFSLFI
ncbi:MAG TPA: site-2 protease family protein [Clostridia bacterium]|nr:site-2 protease family protein [Clostridia bacterium]